MLPEVPKELKLLAASLVGQKLVFPEGLAALPNQKEWWLMPVIKSHPLTVLLSADGENELLVTAPENIDSNYCLQDDSINERSAFLVIINNKKEVLMQSPLVINWDNPSKQIFTSDYEVFQIPEPGKKECHLHIVN